MKRTAEDIVYSIRHNLKKLNVKTDDLNDRSLMYRIPAYANRWMQEIYAQRKKIDDAWYMRLGLVELENVNSGDDPNVMNGSVVLAKYGIKSVITFGDKPAVRAYNGLRNSSYTYIQNFDMFFCIYRADRAMLNRYPCHVLSNDAIYVYPNNGLQLELIPANPFEWMVKREILNPNTGEVIYAGNELRPFGWLDPYPISPEIEYFVILDIIEKDFGQQRNRIIDKMQEGNDETG